MTEGTEPSPDVKTSINSSSSSASDEVSTNVNSTSTSNAPDKVPTVSDSTDNGLSKDIKLELNATDRNINKETIENAVRKYIQIENAVNHYVQSVQISLNTIKGAGLAARGTTKLNVEQSNDSSQEVESLLFYTLLPDQTEDVDEVFIMQSLSDEYQDKLIETELDKMFPERVSYEIKGDIINVTSSTGEIESFPMETMVNNIIKTIDLKNLAKTYIENVQRHEINMQTISRALSSNSLKIDGNLVDSDVNIRQMNKNVQKTRHLLDMSDKVAHKLLDEHSSDVKPTVEIKTSADVSNEDSDEAETHEDVQAEEKVELKQEERKFKLSKVLSIVLVVFIVIVLGGLLLYFSIRPSQMTIDLIDKMGQENRKKE